MRLYVFSQWKCFKVDYVKKYGKWAVITGATDGIGLAMAKELALRGHSLIIIGRNTEKLRNTKETLEGMAGDCQIQTVQIDMADQSVENYQRVYREINPEGREIGILINNAGCISDTFKRFNRYELEEMQRVINVNVIGSVFTTKLVMPSMIQRGRGLVVFVSSMAGCIDSPYMTVYGQTKTFINSFSRALQLEYSAHPNLDIINLTPGGVSTKLFQEGFHSDRINKSFLIPTADRYAKVAINALGTRMATFSGYLPHGLNLELVKLIETLGFSVFKLYIEKKAVDVPGMADISPVPRRRRRKS